MCNLNDKALKTKQSIELGEWIDKELFFKDIADDYLFLSQYKWTYESKANRLSMNCQFVSYVQGELKAGRSREDLLKELSKPNN